LKSDGSSSIEALKQAVAGLQLPKNVNIKIVHTDVGHFNDSDISLAQASGALLLGFNISLNAILKKKAENLKIEMKSFDIIYELTDYLDKLLQGMIEYEKQEVVIGKLEVLGIFYSKFKDMTIWGKVSKEKPKINWNSEYLEVMKFWVMEILYHFTKIRIK
jgi:translation initiation factor IF-2